MPISSLFCRVTGALPRVLLCTQAAVWLATGATTAVRDQPDSAGFQTSVLPFLSKNCIACHSDKLQSGGLNLQAFPNAASVAKDSVRWPLVSEKLLSRQMPPPGLPRPKEADAKTVTDWIAKEIEREDRMATPNPGHITARRLNRTEYNNAVRDLLGVNSQPADAFPPDDSGYGFDNIGDVLSVSPSLMEKYVSVAEKVARAALYGPPQMKPALVKHEPWYVDFDTRPGVKTDYDETGLSLPSALHVMHRFPVEGDYDIAGLLRGNRPFGSEAMQVAYWIDGKQVTVIPYPIPASGEVSGQRKEFRTHVTAGDHWMAVSFLRIYEGLPVSFHGPNPSKLPPPPPRIRGGAGRGGAPATPPTARPDPNAVNNNESSAGAAVGLFVSNLEVTGPYNQVPGPSEVSRRKIFVCTEETRACANKIVATLAGRMYRRPATRQEIEQLTGLVAMAQRNGDSFKEGLCLAIERMMISPNFLFRIEQDRKGRSGQGTLPVSDYELASRLSSFLWSSTPDDELLNLAAQQKLRRPEVLKLQVTRMLKDTKSQALVDDFGGQWLQFRALESHEPERKKFQEYTEYTRMSMQKETELFLSNLIREDRPVTELLNAKYTFINQRLAEFYGIPGVKGTDFRKVDLTGTNREGVLTQGSVLTVSSYANRTSPVIRGKWVLENILNTPPPPPPPGTPALDETGVGTTVSLREQLEKHRANAVCASCHSRMDPLGFALENFDAIGQWRTKDGKFPIDSTGQMPDGRKFQGTHGLTDVLMSDANGFAKAVAEKMLTYALGRGLESYDRPAVAKIVTSMAADQYRFSTLVLGVVNSVPFEERRTSPVTAAPKSKGALSADVRHP